MTVRAYVLTQTEVGQAAAVAEQIPALKELLDMRGRLSELLGKMEGNDKLDQLLAEVLDNSENAKSLADELGVGAGAASGSDDGADA